MKPNYATLPALPRQSINTPWTMVAPVLCTSHLPEAVFNALPDLMGSSLMGELNNECGVLINIDHGELDEYTDELGHLLRYLAARNYEYVRLDSTGNEFADLPAWEWTTGEPIQWEPMDAPAEIPARPQHDGPFAEALDALDYLLTQTVDADLAYGIGLSEGEADAREKALAVFAKYGQGKHRVENRTVEGMPT